ncbi:MAG: 50S ribosomal protein L14e [Promethearchaeota archaeon]
MGIYEVGRVCVKLMGREAGYLCVIAEIIDKNYALIDGLKVRRRRCNFNHLTPTIHKIDIKARASTEEINKAIDAAGLKEKFETKVVPKLQL